MEDCKHEHTEYVPETGERCCANRKCGIVLSEEKPVSDDSRIISFTERQRHIRNIIHMIDDEQLQRLREERLKENAGYQDRYCEHEGCQAPPELRSKWCLLHRREHVRMLTRMSVQKHREKLSTL